MEEEAKKAINENGYKLIFKKPYKVFENLQSYIIICGVGLEKASACVGWIKAKYEPKEIYNFGAVGCIDSSYSKFKIFYVDKAYYSCVDLTSFGYKYGQHSNSKPYYSANIENYLNLEKTNIASSDIFVSSKKIVDNTISNINDKITICDMECAAIFHICDFFEINYCSIKIVSDVLDKKEDNSKQFKETLEKISEMISLLITKLNTMSEEK